MKFTIIIPTYNRKQTIDRAINSVIKQKETNWNLIIVDDGSTDNTQQHIKSKYSNNPKIDYIFCKQNQGVNAARNIGVKHAILKRGDIVIFLDSDDEITSDALSKINKTILTYSLNTIFFFSVVDNNNRPRSQITNTNKTKIISYKQYIESKIVKGEFFPVFKYNGHKSDILFDTTVSGFEDILWLKLIKKYNLVVSPDIVRIYWQDVPSLVRTSRSQRKYKYYQNIIRGKKLFLKNYENDYKNSNKKRLALEKAVLARALLMVGQSKSALEELISSFKYNHFEWRIYFNILLWMTKIKI